MRASLTGGRFADNTAQRGGGLYYATSDTYSFSANTLAVSGAAFDSNTVRRLGCSHLTSL